MAKIISILMMVTAATILPACASQHPRPVAALARASTLIELASKSGAQQFAGADVQRARDKLRFANEAADHEKQERALRFAQQAAADAEVAIARAQSAKAQQSAREIRDSVRALRMETSQSTASETSVLQP